MNKRPLKNYGVWTDDYLKHPQTSLWVPHKLHTFN
jgi:hypothetical protein